MPKVKTPPKPETETQQEAGEDCPVANCSNLLIKFDSPEALLELLCHKQYGAFPIYDKTQKLCPIHTAPNPPKTPAGMAGDNTRLILLGRGKGRNHAEEIKSLGLKVGDTIRGREGGDTPGRSRWNDVRLTVLWVGENQAVYRKQWRSNRYPEGWKDDGETACFSLSFRDYYLEVSAHVDARANEKQQ